MLAANLKLFSNFSTTSDCSALPLLSSIKVATRLFSVLLMKNSRRSHRFSVLLRESNSRSISITIRWEGISVMSTAQPSPPHELVRLDLSTLLRISLSTLLTFKFALVLRFLKSVLEARPAVVECLSNIFVLYRLYAVDAVKLDFLYQPILLKQPCSYLFR